MMVTQRRPFSDDSSMRRVVYATDRVKIIKAEYPTISEKAAELLGQIFAPPKARISSLKVYEEAKKIETFVLSGN